MTSSRCRPDAGRPGGGARPGRDDRRGRAAADGAHRRAPGPPAVAGRLPGAGRGAPPAADPEDVQPAQPRHAPRPGLHAARHRAGRPPAGAGPGRPGPRPPTTPSWRGCGPRCARTRATAATSARTTPAGPSATTGSAARPTTCPGGSASAPTRSRGTFDRICDLLEELGYLHGDEVTQTGRALGVLYTELDLLTAECLREGVWEGLSPGRARAAVAPLVYESRRDDDTGPPQLPAGRTREVLAETLRRWAALEERERAHRLTPAREPDLRFAWATYRWASGQPLDAVLRGRRPGARRLRPLDQAGGRPARPAGRRRAARARRGERGRRRPQGGRPAAPRRGGLLLGGLTDCRSHVLPWEPCWRPRPRPLRCRSCWTARCPRRPSTCAASSTRTACSPRPTWWRS